MKIEIRERPTKMVLFFMSKEEAADEQIMISLKPQFTQWRQKKYLPVVFESGDDDLEDVMYALMKRNLEGLAKKELAKANSSRQTAV